MKKIADQGLRIKNRALLARECTKYNEFGQAMSHMQAVKYEIKELSELMTEFEESYLN
jgi:hypothetical protein